MTVLTDSLFRMGKSHHVCQDYALSGHDKTIGDYIIVCDGCSSSDNTDVGARILAHAAKGALAPVLLLPNSIEKKYEIFGNTTIHRAKFTLNIFDLPLSALDATLLVAVNCLYGPHAGKVVTFIYGDGYAINKTDSYSIIRSIEFKSGAPYYLSYWADDNRKEAYRKMFGDFEVHDKILLNNEEESNILIKRTFDEPIFDITDSMNKTLILSTDGLDTFSSANGMSFKADDVYEPLIAFKNTNGEYLKRRVNKHCAQLIKDNAVYHQDDLGMASMIISEE